MGNLVTLDLPDDSPMLALPWIVTFGPSSDEAEWDPVVCGPYEHAHAMALAETVVADDDDLLAVVEPLQPHASVDEIRAEIELARANAEEFDEDDLEGDLDDEFDALDHEHDEDEEIEPSEPPSPAEVRAGFARIANRLTAGV